MTPFAAIVVAAGSGRRLGAGGPKALVEVGGRSLVSHAVERLDAAGATGIVVVAPPGRAPAITAVLPGTSATVNVVDGGARRADSVRAGLGALPDDVEVVAVHDAARGLAPADLVVRTVQALAADVVAVAPAVPVSDTIKRVDADTVVATVDRTPLVAVQTPQVFRAHVLRAAHADARDATDDLALVEQAIAAGSTTGRVVVVRGDALAMKVTVPRDLAVAATLLQEAR